MGQAVFKKKKQLQDSDEKSSWQELLYFGRVDPYQEHVHTASYMFQ